MKKNKKEANKKIFESIFYIGLGLLFISIFYSNWDIFIMSVFSFLLAVLYFEIYHPQEKRVKARLFHFLIMTAIVIIIYLITIMRRFIITAFIQPENVWMLYSVLILIAICLTYIFKHYWKEEKKQILIDIKKLKFALK